MRQIARCACVGAFIAASVLTLCTGCSHGNTDTATNPPPAAQPVASQSVEQRVQAIQNDSSLPADQKRVLIGLAQGKHAGPSVDLPNVHVK